MPALKASVDHPDFVCLRLYREPTPVFSGESPDFEIGRASVLREGTDLTVVACGPHVGYCLRWLEVWGPDASIATSGPFYELLDYGGLGEEGVRSAIDELLA